MKSQIFFRELKDQRNMLISWFVSISLFILSAMALYHFVIATGKFNLNDMFANLPIFLHKFFGVNLFDTSIALEYYGTIFLVLSVLMSIFSVTLGVSLITKSEKNKTADILHTKPISRSQILRSKLKLAFAGITVFSLIIFGVSLLAMCYFVSFDSCVLYVLDLSLALYLLQLIFCASAVAVASLTKKASSARIIVAAFVIIFFAIAVLTDALNIPLLHYFTPFQYFSAKDILKTGFDWIYGIAAGVKFIVFIFIAFKAYKYRSIKA